MILLMSLLYIILCSYVNSKLQYIIGYDEPQHFKQYSNTLTQY